MKLGFRHLMIGDGFGFEQAEAGRLLVPGGELTLDELDPNPGSVDVSNVFGEITDSAAGARWRLIEGLLNRVSLIGHRENAA